MSAGQRTSSDHRAPERLVVGSGPNSASGADRTPQSRVESHHRIPPGGAAGRQLVNDAAALCGDPGDALLHLLYFVIPVPAPARDLRQHSERMTRAEGECRIARKALVGNVGVVLDRTSRLNNVDALGLLARCKFGPPYSRVQRRSEVHPGERITRGVVRAVTHDDLIARA